MLNATMVDSIDEALNSALFLEENARLKGYQEGIDKSELEYTRISETIGFENGLELGRKVGYLKEFLLGSEKQSSHIEKIEYYLAEIQSGNKDKCNEFISYAYSFLKNTEKNHHFESLFGCINQEQKVSSNNTDW